MTRRSRRSSDISKTSQKRGAPEADRFDLLALIIVDYERKRRPIEPPDTIDAIRYRMETGGYTQADRRVVETRPDRIEHEAAGMADGEDAEQSDDAQNESGRTFIVGIPGAASIGVSPSATIPSPPVQPRPTASTGMLPGCPRSDLGKMRTAAASGGGPT